MLLHLNLAKVKRKNNYTSCECKENLKKKSIDLLQHLFELLLYRAESRWNDWKSLQTHSCQ